MRRTTGTEGASGALHADALSGFDSAVMAIAGCGPAYTIAATIPVLIATVGVASPAVLLYCALPMVGVALAFRQLGRLDVNAGASYSWVARGLHPFLGFLCGWALVVSATVFLASTTGPAGDATLALLGVAHANPALATAVGAGWFVLMAGVVMLGARISAHAQTVITMVQLALLIGFAVAALAHHGNVMDFSASWFGFSHFHGTRTFVSGALIAVVSYWGWDVTSNLSEETRRRGGRSGLGGLLGLLTAFALFAVFTIATNILIGDDAVRRNPDHFLSVLGNAILPGWGGRLLLLAVLLSTVATLETTLIQATRTLFAMGRDRTVSARFGRIHPVRQTPWTATLAVAGVALVLVVAAATAGSAAAFLADAVNGIGLQIALYYGLASLTAVVVHRRSLLRSPGNLLLLGLWPLAGSLFMLWVFVESLPQLDTGALAVGVGTLALGLVPMLLSRYRGSSYYRPRPLEPERAGEPDAGPEQWAAGRRDEVLTDF